MLASRGRYRFDSLIFLAEIFRGRGENRCELLKERYIVCERMEDFKVGLQDALHSSEARLFVCLFTIRVVSRF